MKNCHISIKSVDTGDVYKTEALVEYSGTLDIRVFIPMSNDPLFIQIAKELNTGVYSRHTLIVDDNDSSSYKVLHNSYCETPIIPFDDNQIYISDDYLQIACNSIIIDWPDNNFCDEESISRLYVSFSNLGFWAPFADEPKADFLELEKGVQLEIRLLKNTVSSVEESLIGRVSSSLFCFHFDSPVTLEKCRRYMEILHSYLCYASKRKVEIGKVFIVHKDVLPEDIESDKSEYIMNWVLYSSEEERKAYTESRISYEQTIKNVQLIQQWFEISKKHYLALTVAAGMYSRKVLVDEELFYILAAFDNLTEDSKDRYSKCSFSSRICKKNPDALINRIDSWIKFDTDLQAEIEETKISKYTEDSIPHILSKFRNHFAHFEIADEEYIANRIMLQIKDIAEMMLCNYVFKLLHDPKKEIR